MSTANRALTSVRAQEANAKAAYSRQPTEGNRLKWKRLEYIRVAVAEKIAREAGKEKST